MVTGDEIDVVQDQLAELSVFKEEVVPRHVDVEFLNQQGAELTRDAPPEQVPLPLSLLMRKITCQLPRLE